MENFMGLEHRVVEPFKLRCQFHGTVIYKSSRNFISELQQINGQILISADYLEINGQYTFCVDVDPSAHSKF